MANDRKKELTICLAQHEKLEWLKSIRLSRKMTQLQVAEKGGFARNYYTMVENGKRKPSVNIAKKIGESLDFDWTMFFE